MSEIFKDIKWFNVLIILLPPIVLAWPLVDSVKPFPFKTYVESPIPKEEAQQTGDDKFTKINAPELPKEIHVQGVSDSVSSRSLFSLLFKVQTLSMPIELCNDNQNKIFEGTNIADPNKLIDAEEAGATSIHFKTLTGDSGEVYAKLGKKECKELQIEGATLSTYEIRSPLPLKVEITQKEKGLEVSLKENNKFALGIPQKIGFYHIKWVLSVFVINLLTLIFAWWLFLTSCFAVWKFIHSSDK